MALTDAEQIEVRDTLRRLSFGLDPGGATPYSNKGEVVTRLRAIDGHVVGLMNLPALTAALNAKVAAAQAKELTEADVEQALRDVLTVGVGGGS